MEDEDTEKLVMSYLKKKGFKKAELAFREEQKQQYHGNNPPPYSEGYKKLRSWVNDSYGFYKPELLEVLYPVFVHCFMDLIAKGHRQEARTFFHSFSDDHMKLHAQDVLRMGRVVSLLRLEDTESPHRLREDIKAKVEISRLSYGLLLEYLCETRLITLLPYMKEHINFQVLPSEDEEAPSEISTSFQDYLQDQSTVPERCMFQGLRNRVRVKCVPPSVRFYTFNNITNYSLSCSSISQDGSLLAGGFTDSTIKVWNMPKVEQLPDASDLQGENKSYILLQGHHGSVNSTTFSPLGDMILSSSTDSTIRLWSTKLNTNLACYKGHNSPVWDAKFSPVGHYFASSSHDKTARVWSTDRIHPFRIMAGHSSSVDCVEWHPSGKCIATASDKTVRLWDVSSRKCVRTFTGHQSLILSLAMSVNGVYMASGDEEGEIRLWDVATGQCITPLLGHKSCVWTLGFSCEGPLLASGSANRIIKIWDPTTCRKAPQAEEAEAENVSTNSPNPLKTLETKAPPVHALQFFRGNTLLFAAGPLS